MKRLLCIVGGMNAGGAETFLMKIYRHIDRELYQMDFCVTKDKKGFYDDEISQMGGKIYHITGKSKNPFLYVKSLFQLIKRNEYQYVMRTSQHSLAAIDLFIAMLAGAKVRVYRSSNSHTMKNGTEVFFHKIFDFLPKLCANVKMAPSLPAAEFMFGKSMVRKGKVIFLKNGIPIEEYAFSEHKREALREMLGIGNRFVVGHIGRFTDQKNHKKVVEIFAEITSMRDDAVLVLVGDGELVEETRRYAEQMHIINKVLFLGVRKDIPDILSSFDVLIFPSLYEGMPNTIIEAQANGLPCVISDTITQDVKMCNNVCSLSLNADATLWAEEILKNCERISSCVNAAILQENGYDIKSAVADFTKSIFAE